MWFSSWVFTGEVPWNFEMKVTAFQSLHTGEHSNNTRNSRSAAVGGSKSTGTDKKNPKFLILLQHKKKPKGQRPVADSSRKPAAGASRHSGAHVVGGRMHSQLPPCPPTPIPVLKRKKSQQESRLPEDGGSVRTEQEPLKYQMFPLFCQLSVCQLRKLSKNNPHSGILWLEKLHLCQKKKSKKWNPPGNG